MAAQVKLRLAYPHRLTPRARRPVLCRLLGHGRPAWPIIAPRLARRSGAPSGAARCDCATNTCSTHRSGRACAGAPPARSAHSAPRPGTPAGAPAHADASTDSRPYSAAAPTVAARTRARSGRTHVPRRGAVPPDDGASTHNRRGTGRGSTGRPHTAGRSSRRGAARAPAGRPPAAVRRRCGASRHSSAHSAPG